MSGDLRQGREGQALHLTLDNAARKNALSLSLLDDLLATLNGIDPGQVRIVFVRGAGRVFGAGADMNDITGTGDDAGFDELMRAVCGAIASCPAPVVALVEGPCVGAAVDLALACDLRVLSQDASLRIPATRLGLLYHPKAVAELHRRYRSDALRRLLVLGEKFSAGAALEAGLASEVVPEGGLADRGRALAGLAAETSSVAAALTKSLLDELDRGAADIERWQAHYRELLSSEGRKEAVERLKLSLGASAPTAKIRAGSG